MAEKAGESTDETTDNTDQTTDLGEKAALAAAAESDQNTNNDDDNSEDTDAANTSDILDIDAHEKVIFQGKEYTPEQLNKALLMQSDYTKKTQVLAEDRKYYDNLEYDLANVRENPKLVDQFKETYPEKFHAFLKFSENTGANTGTKTDTDSKGSDNETLLKRLDEMQNKLDVYDQKAHDERVEATNAKLDAKFDKLSQEFDLADEDAVINRAQRMLEENKDNPNFQITDSAWKRLFKADHEARDKRYSERHTKLLKEQAEKGKKGTDSGAGGVPPGRERKRMSFDEATEMAIQDLSR